MFKKWEKEFDEIYDYIKGRLNFTLGVIMLIAHGDVYNHASEYKHNKLVISTSICGMILGANRIYTGLHDLLDERKD